MTQKEKQTLWESLHECHSISRVIGHSCTYADGDHPSVISLSNYATLLERSSKLLEEAIAMIDNLKDA